ncbi:MAG: MgtC/SapB family protein [Bacteroidales bacterium]|nr:MgtC/SapB family protein [Bacteroidales bacterium]
MQEIFIKMFLTFLLALLFGLERQKSHKPIGFGTFVFVAVGSCGLSIVAMQLNIENPLPLLGSIITGIGFLGAGALIKTSDKIFGFTTAASVWLFAIIGLIIGVGYYYIGALIYASIWSIILIDNLMKKRGTGSYQKKIELRTKVGYSEKVDSLLREFLRVKMISIEFDSEKKAEVYHYIVECSGVKLRKLAVLLRRVDWILGYKIE